MLTLFLWLSSCRYDTVKISENSQSNIPITTPEPSPIKPPIPAELVTASVDQLCSRLKDIKTIPTFEPTPTDPIYEALVAKDEEAVPCLIAKITDITPIDDPRYSVPHVQFYAVGDTAIFVLVEIVGKDDKEREKLLVEMMPPRYQKEWETNGIYAYFNYVVYPEHRRELQGWWRKRLLDRA